MRLLKLLAMILHLVFTANSAKNEILQTSDVDNNENLQLFLQEVLIKNLVPYKCVFIITDDLYANVFEKAWFKRFGAFITFIIVNVADYEDLLSPNREIQVSLLTAKYEGCQMYIVLVSNGVQVTRLLRFGDRYRVIDTRSKFIILYDNRLFDKKLFYIWKKIINVIFVRQYEGKKSSNVKRNGAWLEITTVPFPSPITSILVPRRLDIWTNLRFRKGVDLYRDKTSDLRNQTLRIAAYAHIPGTVKNVLNDTQETTTIMQIGRSKNESLKFTGVEIEILKTVSDSMNFHCELYEPSNIDLELWGNKHSGLIGEMVKTQADLAVGDLYYTPSIFDLMDLSVPYNTECLTFLTPEALTDNSWKTLILPFSPIMWACVIICLIICGVTFHVLARFHENINEIRVTNGKNRDAKDIKKKKVITLSLYPEIEKLDPNVKYTLMKDQYSPLKEEGQAIGLYQFSEWFNSMLYTYSMLLLVSLPKLPTGWSLRMLTGWYWLYCLLVVVAYRASMTAILSRPTPRVTIDTISELVTSKLPCGGWGEINRDFFRDSQDPTLKQIGENFEIVNNSNDAVDRVAEGTFAFYENVYFLKEALVKRQLRFLSNFSANQSQDIRDIVREDRNLHIMTDCIIKMPISIGLQKNSPIKPRIDKIIRRVLEAGLIKKWMDNVMAKIINSAESQRDDKGRKAIMDMKKFFGALVALFIGYFISSVTLIVEVVYFSYFVKRNPSYNKYSKRIENIKKAE